MKFLMKGSMIALFALVTACASTSDPSEAYKGQTGEQIFKGGEDSLRKGSYNDAIKHFEALDVQYPFGLNTETAQLHLIYAYYMNSDYLSAEAAADRFIHAHPTSPHVDYAYYMRGLSNYYQNIGVFERLFTVDFATRDLSQIKKSYADFSDLIKYYPNSVYAPAAQQYTVYLRNVMANHELEIAQYYYDRQAYVASANRASLVVKHYQGAPVVPDALVLMAKSYHQLHLADSEKEVIDVINYNYPNSIYLKQVIGDQANSSKIMIAPRQVAVVPKEQIQLATPPGAVQVSSMRDNSNVISAQMNGVRGKSPVTLGTLVSSLSQKVKMPVVKSEPSSPQHRQVASTHDQQAVAQSGEEKTGSVNKRSYLMNGMR